MKLTPTPELAMRMADLTYELLHNCSEKLEYLAETLGLALSEFKCLRAFHRETSLSVKDIACRMNLTSSRLTRIVDGLEEKGLVRREIHRDDRRVIHVVLTEKGLEATKVMVRETTDMHASILQNIEPTSRQAVITALEQLATALGAWKTCR